MLISKLLYPNKQDYKTDNNRQVHPFKRLNPLPADQVCFTGNPSKAASTALNEVVHCNACRNGADTLEKVLNSFKKHNNLLDAARRLGSIINKESRDHFKQITADMKQALPSEFEGSIVFRIKEPDSIMKKIVKYFMDSSEVDDIEKLRQAYNSINDAVGLRLSLHPKNLTTDKIIEILKKFNNIAEIKNYSGTNTRPYADHGALVGFINKRFSRNVDAPRIFIKTEDKKSGYKAIHIIFGKKYELQIKSKAMTRFGNWEHTVKYKPHGEVGEIYQKLNESQRNLFDEYLIKCYDHISYLDDKVADNLNLNMLNKIRFKKIKRNVQAKEPLLPESLPKELKFNFGSLNDIYKSA